MKKLQILLIFLVQLSLSAQEIKAPEQFLGYPIGSRFTFHHQLTSYFEYLYELDSSRMKLETYGYTYESRPLLLAYFGSPENLNKLDEISLRQQQIIENTTGYEENDPVIIWLSYNVHGNEASGSEAAMLTAWYLLTNPKMKPLLQNAIIIMDPCLNPDGRERYVQWITEVSGVTNNPQTVAIEQNEPWPGGRQNHYLFDLNRDWAWQTQIESRQRLIRYHDWMPHVHVDFHEQGYNDPYYFAPAAKPYHVSITAWQKSAQEIIGQSNASYFDRNNWLYFTGEVFDLLYPSYGDSYPIFNGSIGMTYEQAGQKSVGVITETGDTLTLAERALHHFTTSISTIEATVKNSTAFKKEFELYYANPNPTKYNSYIIRESKNSSRLTAFLALLERNRIAYGHPASGQKVQGYDYRSNGTKSLTTSSKDIVIPVKQPRGQLANVLLEPSPYLEDSLTYDMTAWSLIYNYQLNGFATESSIAIYSGFEPEIIANQQIEKAYAFVINENGLSTIRLAAQLMNAGIKIRSNQKSFKMAKLTFKPGSLIITAADNRAKTGLSDVITSFANAIGVKVYALQTGLVDSGPDLGSDDITFLKPPKIILVRGEGISSTSFGAAWYFLEQQIGYLPTVVDVSDLSRVNWPDYTHLIIPSSRINLSDDLLLNEWIKSGGTLISWSYGASNILKSDIGEIAISDNGKDSKEEKKFSLRNRYDLSESVSGAIYEATIDETDPLCFGLTNPYFFFKNSSTTFEASEDYWSPIKLAGSKPVAGFQGGNIRFPGKSLVAREEVGRGNILLFSDEPTYRGFWHGGLVLFSNSLFYSSLF